MHAWKIEMTATFNAAKYVRRKRAESLSWRNARRMVWPMNTHVTEVTTINVSRCISRNGPYIGGHLAFYFKLNFKQLYNVL